MLKVVIGLGNEMPLGKQPSKYAGTRHNVGADFITHLSVSLKAPFQLQEGFKYYQEHQCFFVILNSYMNHSGTAIQKVLSHFQCLPEETLIIHDEIELSYGRLKFKRAGGHRGHNGLRHTIQCLGTNHFCRLSIGVDRVESDDLSDYVLSQHQPAQKDKIMQCFHYLYDNLENILTGQFQEVSL
jgi:PTH1 family peptidyl-tRNA hydrolase